MDYSDTQNFQLNAIYIGKRMKKFLDEYQGYDIKVHSIFHKVINLNTPLGLLSIVNGEVGRSSTYAVIQEKVDFELLDIKPGMVCKCSTNGLMIQDKLTVILKEANVWNELISRNLIWSMENIPFENLISFKSALDRYTANNSAWKRLFVLKEKAFIESIGKFQTKDKPLLGNAINNLIGFGPGLTPTGDDVILGFLAVANHFDNYESIRETLYKSIALNLHRTTDISKSMLEAAIAYEYHEYLQEVIYSIACGKPENVLISTKRLLKIGATSGSDIATGVYIGLMFEKKVC